MTTTASSSTGRRSTCAAAPARRVDGGEPVPAAGTSAAVVHLDRPRRAGHRHGDGAVGVTSRRARSRGGAAAPPPCAAATARWAYPRAPMGPQHAPPPRGRPPSQTKCRVLQTTQATQFALGWSLGSSRPAGGSVRARLGRATAHVSSTPSSPFGAPGHAPVHGARRVAAPRSGSCTCNSLALFGAEGARHRPRARPPRRRGRGGQA